MLWSRVPVVMVSTKEFGIVSQDLLDDHRRYHHRGDDLWTNHFRTNDFDHGIFRGCSEPSLHDVSHLFQAEDLDSGVQTLGDQGFLDLFRGFGHTDLSRLGRQSLLSVGARSEDRAHGDGAGVLGESGGVEAAVQRILLVVHEAGELAVVDHVSSDSLFVGTVVAWGTASSQKGNHRKEGEEAK